MTFEPWPKVPRLFRDCVITEKIDGTNAAIGINWMSNAAADSYGLAEGYDGWQMAEDGDLFQVYAQSRSRIITPETDNHGFARWVASNADELAHVLGDGLHFGEWWGSGIQRRYGLTGDDKRFSLFNAARWRDVDFGALSIEIVPVIYEGIFDTGAVNASLDLLRDEGSLASPGFDNPEGICVFHTQSRQIYKATLENDATPKSLA